MRTLIFATKTEGYVLSGLFDKVHLVDDQESLAQLPNFMDDNEDGIAIMIGRGAITGWKCQHPTNVLFSRNFDGDSAVRMQAQARAERVTLQKAETVADIAPTGGPRYIGQDPGAAKKITHKACGAALEYHEGDVKLLWSGKDISGGPDGAKGFTCPKCGENVITERW